MRQPSPWAHICIPRTTGTSPNTCTMRPMGRNPTRRAIINTAWPISHHHPIPSALSRGLWAHAMLPHADGTLTCCAQHQALWSPSRTIIPIARRSSSGLRAARHSRGHSPCVSGVHSGPEGLRGGWDGDRGRPPARARCARNDLLLEQCELAPQGQALQDERLARSQQREASWEEAPESGAKHCAYPLPVKHAMSVPVDGGASTPGGRQ
jgi:hypothetical protein